MKPFAFAAALALAALTATPALADVASTLSTAGDAMLTWVRTGAFIVFIIMGLLIAAGFRNLVAFGAAVVGLAIALDPSVIVGWIG